MHAVKRTLWGILALNLLVAAAKLGYGLVTGSVAMTADGFHSVFDGTSNVIGLLGMGIAGRPADADHPYGHAKYETFASAVIAIMLLIAAWRVGSSAVSELLDPGPGPRVDALSFVVMIGTLIVNIVVTTYERRVGRRLGSEILLADASHTASDVLVSLGVIAGLIAVRLGYPLADPIIGLGVAVAILAAAVRVFKSANATLSDQARMPVEDICDAALTVPGVLGCHDVRTRGLAMEVYVDLHIQVDPGATVAEGHDVAEQVERHLCDAFDQIADVIAHVEPFDAYQREKTARQSEDGTP
ncbi:MAG: cation diffusion facilitator family transporter [Anaerosomatales bacterium]|nr:cation diffusion facilitator family transporter [Anaerosomatales bacterium]